jgi:hypothetical protein
VYDGKCEEFVHMVSIKQISMLDMNLRIRMYYLVNLVCLVYDGNCEGHGHMAFIEQISMFTMNLI